MKDVYFIKNKKQLLVIGLIFLIIQTMAFLSLLFFNSTTQITHLFNQSTPLSISIYSNFHSLNATIEIDKDSYAETFSSYQQLLDKYANDSNIKDLLYDYYIYDTNIYFGKDLSDSNNYQCFMFDGFSLTLNDNYLEGMAKDFTRNKQYEYVANYYNLSRNSESAPIFKFNPLIIGMNGNESSTMIENNIEIIKGRNIENSNEIVIPNNTMVITKTGAQLVNVGDSIPLTIESNDSIDEIVFTVVGKHNGDGVYRTDINSMENGIPLSEIIFINKDAFLNIQSKVNSQNDSLIIRKSGGITTPLIHLKNSDNLIKTITSFETDISNLNNFNETVYFDTSTNLNENIHFLTTLRQFNAFSLFLLIFSIIAFPFTLYIVTWISLHQRRNEFAILLSMGLSIKKLKQIILKSYIRISLFTMLIALLFSQAVNYFFIKYLACYLNDVSFINQGSIYSTNLLLVILSVIAIILLIMLFIRNIINTIFKSQQLKAILSK